jgi:hypothetical protein
VAKHINIFRNKSLQKEVFGHKLNSTICLPNSIPAEYLIAQENETKYTLNTFKTRKLISQNVTLYTRRGMVLIFVCICSTHQVLPPAQPIYNTSTSQRSGTFNVLLCSEALSLRPICAWRPAVAAVLVM